MCIPFQNNGNVMSSGASVIHCIVDSREGKHYDYLPVMRLDV